MSQILIQQYLNQLQDLRKVSGTHRESVVREAFKDLLKGWARAHDLVFVPEYEIETRTRDRRYVDGALLYELRMPFGYWEAKDEKDDLDAEIETKFRRGYPQDNIIFEDSTEAVLIQNRQEVMRCGVDDVAALEKLLNLFFAYERAEIAEFRGAVEQFKADLPAVLESLRAMIARAYAENAAFRKASQKFLAHAQEAINPSLTDADVREMLIQHVLTEEIFSKVFGEDDFHRHNNVAKERRHAPRRRRRCSWPTGKPATSCSIRSRRSPAFHPGRGTTSSATARRWNGSSTSTRKTSPRTRPSARISTLTASPTTRRK